jgi:predicted nuclease of restriction endonuclease-like (RecB) superfamily
MPNSEVFKNFLLGSGMTYKLEHNQLFESIRKLLVSARQNVLRKINTTMVHTYFEIGRMIVEDEQKGKKRAGYGEKILKNLSNELMKEFGKGFSSTNLKQMKSFYLTYSKGQTVSDQSRKYEVISQRFELSWSHYIFLMRLDERVRKFYEIEAIQNNWSLRELQRQFDSALYERLAFRQDKEKILELSVKGQVLEKPKDMIKDPYIFEFLGLKEDKSYSESELESELIGNLKNFLLELGKGFAFIARQQRITFSEQHFFIDLVFYNRLLKCFVLFDIKIGELKHQDLGQLQMYVNYYDRTIKAKDENKTIGILLCSNKEDAVVEMTLPKNNNQLFASKYKLYLPTKEELIKQIKV